MNTGSPVRYAIRAPLAEKSRGIVTSTEGAPSIAVLWRLPSPSASHSVATSAPTLRRAMSHTTLRASSGPAWPTARVTRASAAICLARSRTACSPCLRSVMSRTLLRNPVARPFSCSRVVVTSAKKRLPSARMNVASNVAALVVVDLVADAVERRDELGRPERERRLGADELVAREAGDPAQRRVDVDEAPVAGDAEALGHAVDDGAGAVALGVDLLAQRDALGDVLDRRDDGARAARVVVDGEADDRIELGPVAVHEPGLELAAARGDRGGVGAEQRAVVLRRPRRQRRRGADDLLGGVAGEGAQRRVDLEDPAAHVGDDHAVADRAEQARAAGDHPSLSPEALLHDRADEGEDHDDEHRAAPRRGRVVRPADGDERHGEDEGDADQRADEMGAAAVDRDPEDREEGEDPVAAVRTAGGVAQHGDDDEPERGPRRRGAARRRPRARTR